MIQLGNTIRKLRKYRGLKQTELADMAGISVAFLCHIERNNREPSPSLVRQLAESLGIPVELLIWDALEPPRDMPDEDAQVFLLAKSLTSRYIDQLNEDPNRDNSFHTKI